MGLSVPARSVVAASALLLWALGCGLGPDRVVLEPPQADACGGITVRVQVDPARSERTLTVWVDDRIAGGAAIPAGAGSVTTRVRAATTEQHRVAAEVGDTRTEPALVAVPRWDAVIGTAPQVMAYPPDAPLSVPVKVLTPCEDLSGLHVDATLFPGEHALLRSEAIPSSRAFDVPIPPLGTGPHEVTVWIREDRLIVDRKDLPFVVGRRCDGDCAEADASDADRDGRLAVSAGGDDCDDFDPFVPRPEELPDPNGRDDDCDGHVDEGTPRFDDDLDGVTEEQGDCDDADPSTHPGAPELGDCRDNDCDGDVDEGVTRPEVDDGYEPNDRSRHALPGAVQMRPVLGFPGGYKPTSARLALVTRSRADVEQFEVWTHDGQIDTWNVSVDVESIGAGRSYEVKVEGGGRVATGFVSAPGQSVGLGDQPLKDDTGTYWIDIVPRDGELTWCPLVVTIRSG